MAGQETCCATRCWTRSTLRRLVPIPHLIEVDSHYRRECIWRSPRHRLTRARARGSSFRNRTSCDGVQPRTLADSFGSASWDARTSKASARMAGKSSWAGLTANTPPSHRDCQSGLGKSSGWRGKRTSRAMFTRNRNSASARFCDWLRRSLASARAPVGKWCRLMAVSTLLRCCPPGPDRRSRRTSHSAQTCSELHAAGWL